MSAHEDGGAIVATDATSGATQAEAAGQAGRQAARRREPKCDECRQNVAEWAMQFIGEDRPSFYLLGWHVRGFAVTKLCSPCKEARQ